MNRLDAFLSRSPSEQFRLLAASGLLVVVWGGLVVFPFAKFRSALGTVGETASRVVPGTASVAQIVYAVEMADTQLPGQRTCLTRSLTTEVLLQAYSHAFDHRIGVVETDDGELEAHSWIEHDGEIVIGNIDRIDTYEPLPPL